MANPAAIAMAVKKAVELAEDKRVRTFILSVIVGFVMIILIPLLAVVSMFNAGAGYSQEVARIVFDGGTIPSEASEELTKYMEDMIGAFEVIDTTIEDMELEEGFDDIKVKSFFYILNFSKDLSAFDEEFYSEYVQYFIDNETDEEIYSELTDFLSHEFTDAEKEEINSLYLFIKYGYTATDKIFGVPGVAFSDETFAQLMSEATKYIGFPYVWGGSSPSTSFDCSGFVCWSYTKSGVYNLPRTTAQGVYNKCVPVSKSEVKPGDLVFFTKTYQSSNPVTHIGIYVGENQMLHCGDRVKRS